MNISELSCFVSKIDQDKEVELYKILDSDSKYKHIDRSVLLALFVSRKAVLESTINDQLMGINFGSSRGSKLNCSRSTMTNLKNKTSFYLYFSSNNIRQYFKLGFS